MNANLLLVEDDIDLGNVIKQYLEIHDFTVRLCRDGESAWTCFQQQAFDLCILDIMLPVMDGFALAKQIKRIKKEIPFIFLTAKNQKVDRVKGLKMGADDYITKPFEIDELVLRIQNILYRVHKDLPILQQIGAFQFDVNNLTLVFKDNTQSLTLQEAKLLQLLLLYQNKVVKRVDILTQLWGNNDYFSGRSMDVFISRLRKYLKADKRISIENIRGVGFRLLIP